MRVIAGEARGTRLAPVPEGTRPLSDRAREGAFSSLGPAVTGARCADLFAGTGAVGIEALSRGAAGCTFVEARTPAIRTIRENLSRTRLEDRARVVRADVRTWLAGAPGPFDLVFLDPPYDLSGPALEEVLQGLPEVLAKGASALLTRPRTDATDVIPVHFQQVRRLTYGDTHVLIAREGS